MAQYRCTQCGSLVTAAEHEKIGKCPACDSLFILPNNFAEKEALYRRAADMRQAGNFAAALTNYGRILKVDAMETEAHWGYLLSKYGVEISADERTFGQIFFHRMETEDFLADPSYEKMVEYCPREALYYYQGLSREISQRHKKMLEIARKLKPIDLYINCAEAPGTPGCALASAIGQVLTEAGYEVFLPGIMLAGMPEEDRNQYEMAAAKKAGNMMVIAASGTDFQNPHLDITWKYFAELRRSDGSRNLLTAFREFRPEDLPAELGALQAVDCGGADYQQRILKAVNEMLGRRTRSVELNRKILKKLKEGEHLLETGVFIEAKADFEYVIQQDPEEGAAYRGLVRALTYDLSRPVLSDELDTAYERALNFLKKPEARALREQVQELMADTAFEALEDLTAEFTDTSIWESEDTQKAMKRVVELYVPRGDERAEQAAIYQRSVDQKQRVDELRRKYENRDASVQPLFVELDKADEKSNVRIEELPEKRESHMVQFLLMSVLLMASAYYYVRYLTGYSLNIASPPYRMKSTVLFLIGLALPSYLCVRKEKYRELSNDVIPALSVILLVLNFIFKLKKVIVLVPWFLPLAAVAEQLICFAANKNYQKAVCRMNEAMNYSNQIAAKIRQAFQEQVEAWEKEYSLPHKAEEELKVAHVKLDWELLRENYRQAEKHPVRPLLVSAAAAIVLPVAVTLISNHYYAGPWHDIETITSDALTVAGIRTDGTVAVSGYEDWGEREVKDWTDIVQLEIGTRYVAGLRSDGTVLIAGSDAERDDHSVKKAEKWTDIVQISGYGNYLAGLRSDGTVVAAGSNDNGQRNVDSWRNITKLLTDDSRSMVVGIQEDGTILCTDEEYQKYFDASTEEGPVQDIYGRASSFVCVYENGLLGVAGNNFFKQIEPFLETDIYMDEVQDLHVAHFSVVVFKDGSVQVFGDLGIDFSEAEALTDAKAVAGSNSEFAVILREDGTVIGIGGIGSGETDVDGWKNVVAVAAGERESYGVLKNGKVVAAGDSRYGMTYVNGKNPVELAMSWVDFCDDTLDETDTD